MSEEEQEKGSGAIKKVPLRSSVNKYTTSSEKITQEGPATSNVKADRPLKPEDITRSTTDFSQSLLDEMESMFRNLDNRRKDDAVTSAKQNDTANRTPTKSVDDVPDPVTKTFRPPAYVSSTLSKAEKKALASGTMKPMSAHDEKTLNTAVALANEITSKSMNDLGGEKKYPHSPNERSKFHFKFPLSLHHGAHAHEPEKEKDAPGRERRNFSEEAKSVPDLQSTITAESKMAYTSLIEEPTSSNSLISHLAKETTSGILKPATIPKPARVTTHVQFHSLQKNMPQIARPGDLNQDEFQNYAQNVLPLPPRTTKPKLVDKPRHIRKYPLKLPGEPKAVTVRPNETQAIIYQNTKNPAQKQGLIETDLDKGIDVFDGAESIVKVDANTNPFTNVAGPSNANPFSSPFSYDNDDELDVQMATESESDTEPTEGIAALVKDCKDHVSVEDLLEFADQKPCGRQRGLESDEVRIMCKVLKEQASPEQCLEALELSNWDVHHAIKMVRVKVSVGTDVSFEDCRAQLESTNGDVVKAAARLVTCNANT